MLLYPLLPDVAGICHYTPIPLDNSKYRISKMLLIRFEGPKISCGGGAMGVGADRRFEIKSETHGWIKFYNADVYLSVQ